MKKKLIVSAMLAILLAFIGCATTGSGDPGTAPNVTKVALITMENLQKAQMVPQTTFESQEFFMVGVEASDQNNDMKTINTIFKFKEDGQEIAHFDFDAPTGYTNITQVYGWHHFDPGEYTAELYIVDVKGNQSNTMAVPFTVIAPANGIAPANPGTAPALSEVITLSGKNAVAGKWVPQTAFKANAEVELGVKGIDPDGNVMLFGTVFTKDNAVIKREERIVNVPVNSFTQFWGAWRFKETGNYTVEVYAVDSKGNKSNSLTAAFTVN